MTSRVDTIHALAELADRHLAQALDVVPLPGLRNAVQVSELADAIVATRALVAAMRMLAEGIAPVAQEDDE